MNNRLKHPGMTAFVLLLSSFMAAADTMTLQPIIELLSTQVFPEAGYATVSLIMTASALALALVSILVSLLLKIGKKRLLVTGSLLFSIGGLAGALYANISFMIFTRIFEGVGAGLVLTVSLMMIPELFQDQAKVDKLMGYNGILMAFFSALITFTSGYMAMVNWKFPFLYYAVGFIILVLQMVYVPADEKHIGDTAPTGRILPSIPGLIHAVKGLAFGLFTGIFFICISGVLAERGIGDASVAGTTATFHTIGSFCSGFLFAKVFGKLKHFSFPFFYVLMVIAYTGFVSSQTTMLFFAFAIINGFGWNWFFSAFLAKVNMVSDESSLEANMAWANGLFYIGQFATPILLTLIVTVTGSASTLLAMQVGLGILIVMLLLHLIEAFRANRKTV